MAVKQTIALIGEVSPSLEILTQLARHYRLLLVTKEKASIAPIIKETPGAEVEVIHCAKDGCWEADIILLAGHEMDLELIERIREVATQKIVIVLIPEDQNSFDDKHNLEWIRKELPYSKVIGVHPYSKTVVFSDDPPAVERVEEIVQLLRNYI